MTVWVESNTHEENKLPMATRTAFQDKEVVVLWYLWGLNPRRLERLADLKSAPLDHSGKIPAKSTKQLYFSRAFFKAVYRPSSGL